MLTTPQVLRHLAPHGCPLTSSCHRHAESLGAHLEGPFLSPALVGNHDPTALRLANTWADILNTYGVNNITAHLHPPRKPEGCEPSRPPICKPNRPPIRMVTVAPEIGRMTPELIPKFRAAGIRVSIGHSQATLDEAKAALDSGATMITHLFNSMRPQDGADKGIVGLPAISRHPVYYSLIADGLHGHLVPDQVAFASQNYPAGLILVSNGGSDGACGASILVRKGAERQRLNTAWEATQQVSRQIELWMHEQLEVAGKTDISEPFRGFINQAIEDIRENLSEEALEGIDPSLKVTDLAKHANLICQYHAALIKEVKLHNKSLEDAFGTKLLESLGSGFERP